MSEKEDLFNIGKDIAGMIERGEKSEAELQGKGI